MTDQVPPAKEPEGKGGAGQRRKLPEERQSITHKFSVSGHEGYITVGMYQDGSPGEIFLVMSKEGSTISGLMDAVAVAVSLCLQYGVPLSVLVAKFSNTRFEPAGFTSNPQITVAKSLMDYVFRWLALKFPAQAKLPGSVVPEWEVTLQEAAGEATRREVTDATFGPAVPQPPSAAAPAGSAAYQPPPMAPGVMPKMNDTLPCPKCPGTGRSYLGGPYGGYECDQCHWAWNVLAPGTTRVDAGLLAKPSTEDDLNTCACCGGWMQPDGSEKVCSGCGGGLTVEEARHLAGMRGENAARSGGKLGDSIPCHACGGRMNWHHGTCYKCHSCGETSGCS